jgi:hypothetical protein
MSVRRFAEHLGVNPAAVSNWERRGPAARLRYETQEILDADLAQAPPDVTERFAQNLSGAPVADQPVRQEVPWAATPSGLDDLGSAEDRPVVTRYLGADGWDALELARRATASDLSADVLDGLEGVVDGLALSYATTPPDQLLPAVRQHLRYVSHLLTARKTLEQHRRLLVVGGWLSLLGATLHIDLRHSAAARARLTTADQLAAQAGHREIQAWCLETQAWSVLTDGNYPAAVALSRQALALAPRGSSVQIQATAQLGRAWARMGDRRNTARALSRVDRLVSPLARPAHPEHHYQYDPGKAVSYTATTLAWVADPAAERYAREAVRELEVAADGVRRPRRVASAQLDLSLALLAVDKPDEASAMALTAIASGRIVPSNRWRVAEIVAAVTAAGIGEASHLRDAFETLCASDVGQPTDS